MEETLKGGDHYLENGLIYGWLNPFTGKRLLKWRDVRRGDIVSFQYPLTMREELKADEIENHTSQMGMTKRVVGLPGDTVKIYTSTANCRLNRMRFIGTSESLLIT
jgi:signal peptidase I